MCRRTEEVGRTVGLPCNKHFVGFFNVPVQAPTRGHLFTVIAEKKNRIGMFILIFSSTGQRPVELMRYPFVRRPALRKQYLVPISPL